MNTQPICPSCKKHPDGFNPGCKDCLRAEAEMRRIARMLQERFSVKKK